VLDLWALLINFSSSIFVLLTLKVIRSDLSHVSVGFHVVVLDCGQPTKLVSLVLCHVSLSPIVPSSYFHLDSCASAWWLNIRLACWDVSVYSIKMVIRFHTDPALFQITADAEAVLFAQSIFMQLLNFNLEH